MFFKTRKHQEAPFFYNPNESVWVVNHMAALGFSGRTGELPGLVMTNKKLLKPWPLKVR